MSSTQASAPHRTLDESQRAVVGVCIFLAILVFAVFGQSCGFGFVNLDDNLYVYQNPVVQNGLTTQGLVRVFSCGMCSFYHPVTMCSLMLDAQLYGSHAGGFHLTNVIIHTATAIILFLVLWQMTGVLWPSAFVAAIFAIHPLHVESVAWVAERKDVLGGLFFMLTLWAYAGYARKSFSPRRYLAVVLFFSAGLLSKPTLVTLPFVLLLLDYWPLGRLRPGNFRSLHPLIAEKIPLFALAAAACALALAAEGKTITPPGKLPLALQLENAVVSYAAYLGQTVWPAGLAPFYPYPKHGLPPWKIAGAMVVVGGISSIALLAWRRPYLLTGWLWYLGVLVPMIGLFQVGAFARADRFTYLPQIGLALMIAFGVKELSDSWRHRRGMLAFAMLASALGLAVCSWQQTRVWRTSEALWRHTLAVTATNAFAHNNLGAALAAGSRKAEAMEQFQAALEINPGSAETHFNLAAVLAMQSKTDEAIQSYQTALELKPDYAEANNNLGILLVGRGRTAEAIRCFEQALTDQPDYAEADNNLGIALATSGRLNDAVKSFHKAVGASPGYVDAHLNLANALALQGRTAAAVQQYQATLRLNPNSEVAKEQLRILESNRPLP